MKTQNRRDQILDILNKSNSPVSASSMAKKFSVSRQIIVGDIALLRASGKDIIATPRGYIVLKEKKEHIKTIACRHGDADIADELTAIVDCGCTVIDVTVEHAVYGQITGLLMLSSRLDVTEFINKMTNYGAKPLSTLTDGIHLHKISCPGEAAYKNVLSMLSKKGILVSN